MGTLGGYIGRSWGSMETPGGYSGSSWITLPHVTQVRAQLVVNSASDKKK
jgi:hypothetical protein